MTANEQDDREDPLPFTGQQLRYGAAALAYTVAALHLFHPSHGFARLVTILAVQPGLLVSSPRPLAFVLSGVAILIGVTLPLLGAKRKPIYVLGMMLMVTYITGYFAWHLSGHGGFLPVRKPLYHGLQPHQAVIQHLTTDPWAAASLVTELLLFGILGVLYRRESE